MRVQHNMPASSHGGVSNFSNLVYDYDTSGNHTPSTKPILTERVIIGVQLRPITSNYMHVAGSNLYQVT